MLRCSESVHTDRPNLRDLACQLGRQEGQVGWYLAIICQPHQTSVDENGKVVTCGVGLASVAYEDCRDNSVEVLAKPSRDLGTFKLP